jgi:hypothetical protein
VRRGLRGRRGRRAPQLHRWNRPLAIAPQLLRMDPSLSYMMGSWRQQLLWMGVALSIVVGMVALHVVLGI